MLAKTAQIFDRKPFFNVISLLEQWEENVKGFLRGRINYNLFLAISLKLTVNKSTAVFYGLYSYRP